MAFRWPWSRVCADRPPPGHRGRLTCSRSHERCLQSWECSVPRPRSSPGGAHPPQAQASIGGPSWLQASVQGGKDRGDSQRPRRGRPACVAWGPFPTTGPASPPGWGHVFCPRPAPGARTAGYAGATPCHPGLVTGGLPSNPTFPLESWPHPVPLEKDTTWTERDTLPENRCAPGTTLARRRGWEEASSLLSRRQTPVQGFRLKSLTRMLRVIDGCVGKR